MQHHLSLGKIGETLARKYLLKKGYTIESTNWRFKRAEIDIIAKKDNWLIFCEVKTRSNTFFGDPDSFVNKQKKRLMVDAATAFLREKEFYGEFRFDIIAIVYKNAGEYKIKHLKDAFFPGLEGFM